MSLGKAYRLAVIHIEKMLDPEGSLEFQSEMTLEKEKEKTNIAMQVIYAKHEEDQRAKS